MSPEELHDYKKEKRNNNWRSNREKKRELKLGKMTEEERLEYQERIKQRKDLQGMSREEKDIEKKRRKSVYNKRFKDKMKLKMTPTEFQEWEDKRNDQRKSRDIFKKHLVFLRKMSICKLPMFLVDSEMTFQPVSNFLISKKCLLGKRKRAKSINFEQ